MRLNGRNKRKDGHAGQQPAIYLSKREQQILDVVYRRGEASADEITASIPRPPSQDAVRRLIRILEEKGHLQHRKEGQRHVYTPTIRREDARRHALDHLIQTYFKGSAAQAMASLLEPRAPGLSREGPGRNRRLGQEGPGGRPVMTPVPLRLFVGIANSSFQFELVLLCAAVISIVLKTAPSEWRRRLWEAAFCAPPVFIALNTLFPSIFVSLLSLPATDMQAVSLTEGAGLAGPGAVFPALVTPVTSPLLSWIAVIGFLGAAGSALRLASGLAAAYRVGKRADAVEDERVLRRGREASLRMGCRRPVRLKTSRQIAVPTVLGLFRPVIVLPPDYRAWPEADLRAALDHEMSHVKHRDPLGRTLARIVCALNWFNPAAWMALRRLIAEQEIEGDHAAVSCGARPSDYAEMLMRRIAPNDAQRSLFLASLGEKAAWRARMRALLLPVLPWRMTRGKRIALGALLAGLILTPGTVGLWDAAAAGPRTVMVHAGKPSGLQPAAAGEKKTRVWMDPVTHRWDYF